MPNGNRTQVGAPLGRLKFEIANELAPQLRRDPAARVDRRPGLQPVSGSASPEEWERLKFEIAQELGVPYKPGYNGDLPAREAGRLGGKIGGNMVRRLIHIAEQALADGYVPRG